MHHAKGAAGQGLAAAGAGGQAICACAGAARTRLIQQRIRYGLATEIAGQVNGSGTARRLGDILNLNVQLGAFLPESPAVEIIQIAGDPVLDAIVREMLVAEVIDGHQGHRLHIETGVHIGLQYIDAIQGFAREQQTIEISEFDGPLNALFDIVRQLGLRQIFAGKGHAIRQRNALLLEHRIKVVLLHGEEREDGTQMRILYLHVGRGALIAPRGAAAIRIEAGQRNGRDPIHARIPHLVRRLGQYIAGGQHLEVEHTDHRRPTELLVRVQLVDESVQLVLEAPATQLQRQIPLFTPGTKDRGRETSENDVD